MIQTIKPIDQATWNREHGYRANRRWRRHEIPVANRLLAHVDWSDARRCWLWKGATIGGYGSLKIAGRRYYAHRLAYETWIGILPAGILVRHRCDNRACINPFHLLPGEHFDNARDRHTPPDERLPWLPD